MLEIFNLYRLNFILLLPSASLTLWDQDHQIVVNTKPNLEDADLALEMRNFQIRPRMFTVEKGHS